MSCVHTCSGSELLLVNTSIGDDLLVSRVDQWLASSSSASATEEEEEEGKEASERTAGPVGWCTPGPDAEEFGQGVRVHMEWRGSARDARGKHRKPESTAAAADIDADARDETGASAADDSSQVVLQVCWHARGDYWASVREHPLAHRSLLVHQLSRRRSQVRLNCC